MEMELLLRYLEQAREAGCPRDQVERLVRAGTVQQPKQLHFHAAARLADRIDGPDRIAFGGARMGGKSHAMLAQVGADDCQRFDGLKCLILRKVGGAAKEGFQDLFPKVFGGLDYEWISSSDTLHFRNGSKIRVGHFKDERDVDKYLGLEYDVIAVEEATQLTATKEIAIRSCCRTAKKGWRARTYYSTNPGGVGHAWFKDTFIRPFREGRERHTRFVPSTVYDNSYAGADYRRFLEGLTGWLRKAWLEGDWDVLAGQFFTTWRHDRIVVQAGSIPEHWRVWLSLDYGFTHYTAVYLFALDGDDNLYTVDEHCERKWLPDRHARAIRQLLDRNGVAEHRLRGIYAGRDVFRKNHQGGTIAADYAELKLPLTAADDDRIAGAAEILARLGDADADPPISPSVFISQRCARLIQCLPGMEHDPHRPEDVLKVDADEDGRGGDDPYDSFRYGVMVAARARTRAPKAGGVRAAVAGYKAS